MRRQVAVHVERFAVFGMGGERVSKKLKSGDRGGVHGGGAWDSPIVGDDGGNCQPFGGELSTLRGQDDSIA